MKTPCIPTQIDRIFALGDDMIDGLNMNLIPIVQNTAAVKTPLLATARTAVTDAGIPPRRDLDGHAFLTDPRSGCILLPIAAQRRWRDKKFKHSLK